MVDMHYIQIEVLRKLIVSPKTRYTDLNVYGLENNAFQYRLQKLIKKEYIKKVEDKYSLTSTGLGFVEKISYTDAVIRQQAIQYTVIICRTDNGKYLCYQRTGEPHYGKIGFPYGKMHQGEKITDAACHEFKEKTGIQVESLQYEFTEQIITDGAYISDSIYYVFSLNLEQEFNVISEGYTCFWVDEKEMRANDWVYGFDEIYLNSSLEKVTQTYPLTISYDSLLVYHISSSSASRQEV